MVLILQTLYRRGKLGLATVEAVVVVLFSLPDIGVVDVACGGFVGEHPHTSANRVKGRTVVKLV